MRKRFFRGAPRPKRAHRINEDIRISEIRLVDENGQQVGIVPTDQAKRMARDRGYDLVEIAPQARPPVCKLLDYGKFLYELKKKKREAEKKHHVQQVKQVRLRPKTDKHDLQTKVNHARQFLHKGDKVLFTVFFRGRENAHKDRGRQMLEHVAADLEDVAKQEGPIRTEGSRMHLTFMPRPEVQQKIKAQEREKEKRKKEREVAKTETVPEGEQHAKVEDGEGG